MFIWPIILGVFLSLANPTNANELENSNYAELVKSVCKQFRVLHQVFDQPTILEQLNPETQRVKSKRLQQFYGLMGRSATRAIPNNKYFSGLMGKRWISDDYERETRGNPKIFGLMGKRESSITNQVDSQLATQVKEILTDLLRCYCNNMN